MGRSGVSFWCYTPVVTLRYVLVTVSWNGFPFIDCTKFIVECFVDGWLVSIRYSSQCCKIKEGLERKEQLSICFLYIYTCTAKKYPSYGIFTNSVLLLIIALTFYCLKYIY